MTAAGGAAEDRPGAAAEAEAAVGAMPLVPINWDLIIHGPAHRGANGAAMPTDEDYQDGNFFFNHPERGGGYPAA